MFKKALIVAGLVLVSAVPSYAYESDDYGFPLETRAQKEAYYRYLSPSRATPVRRVAPTRRVATSRSVSAVRTAAPARTVVTTQRQSTPRVSSRLVPFSFFR